MAPTNTSSGISFDSPSTITTESSLPATTISSSVSSNCSIVGFNINSLLILPTRTPAIGPSNGISEIDSAADAPVIAKTSPGFTLSLEIKFAII